MPDFDPIFRKLAEIRTVCVSVCGRENERVISLPVASMGDLITST